MTSSATGGDLTLDDVVAVARGLAGSLQSLYVETEGWAEFPLARVASERHQRLLVTHPTDVPLEPVGRTTRRVRTWMAFDTDRAEHPFVGVVPLRSREELELTDLGGTTTTSVSATNGVTRWWQHGDRIEQSDGRTSIGSLHSAWVVGRQWLGEDVSVELVEETEVRDRRCARVRVTTSRQYWAPGPLTAGDAHLLDIDLETGLTLAITNLLDGEAFEHHEAVTLWLDVAVDAALTDPPQDAVARSPSVSYRDVRDVAAAAKGLALVAPTWLPKGYTFGTAGARGEDDGEAHAVLYYRREGRPTVTIMERPAPAQLPGTRDELTWIERGDRRVGVSDVSYEPGVRIASAVVAGTLVTLRADLSAAELLDIAFSLQPVAVDAGDS